MKKNTYIIISIIIISIIALTKIDAETLDIETRDNQKVYDYAEILTEDNKEILNKKALSFYQKSHIEIIIITLNEEDDINAQKKASNFYIENNFHQDGLVIIMNKYNGTTTLLKKGKMIYPSEHALIKFNNDIIKKSTLNKEFSYENVLKFVEKCNNYYIQKIIKSLIFILILSLMITNLIIYKLKQKYNLENKQEAKKYYDSSKIKYLKGGEHVNKNNTINHIDTN